LDNSIKPLNVKWREIQYKACEDLPIPVYPPKLVWEDFSNLKNQNGKVINLLKEMESNFKKIIELNKYLQNPNRENIILAKHWKTDASNKKFQNINTTFGDARIYKNKFINSGDNISCKIIKKERFYEAIDIISKNQYVKLKRSIRFPLLMIWNNGNSLLDINVPSDFRIHAQQAIQAAENILSLRNINTELESTMLFFLATLHQDTPKKTIDLLKKYSENSTKLNLLPYSLGTIKLNWQKEIFKNILKNIEANKKLADNLKLFGIVAWRYEDFIINLTSREYIIVIKKLYESLLQDTNREYIYDSKNKVYITILNKLELLLALIRYRKNDKCALNPNDKLNKLYLKLIHSITKTIIEKRLQFSSRIQLNITKPDSLKETPNLLYALNIYLSGDNRVANSIQVLGVSDD